MLYIKFARPLPSQRVAVLDHMAFSATGLKAVKARFDAPGVKYGLHQQAGSGTWKLACCDPSGPKPGLDFDANKAFCLVRKLELKPAPA